MTLSIFTRKATAETVAFQHEKGVFKVLKELQQEITKAECYGSIEITIFLNPFFKKMFNIDESINGHPVVETESVTDYKIIVDYE